LHLYRDLRDADLLRTRGVFVAEGRLVVERVIDDGRFDIQSILVNGAALAELSSALSRLDACVPIYVCRNDVFPAVMGFNLHRGCVAMVRRPPLIPPATVIAAAKTLVVLDAVSNADNVGGILRNAAAFGADGVLLSPSSCDPLYRKAIRTSMGAALQVPFARFDAHDWPAVLASVREAGITLVALTPVPRAEDLEVFVARARPARVALILGAEGAGLTPEVEAAADVRVRIPIAEGVDSLNVAVAAGIALYRLKT
jgi:tRNA G18 (ribose-2'-O)-methylase SpoU